MYIKSHYQNGSMTSLLRESRNKNEYFDMKFTAESLRLHRIASVKVMLGKGPIGIMRRIVRESQSDVHLALDATYQTKAFLIT